MLSEIDRQTIMAQGAGDGWAEDIRYKLHAGLLQICNFSGISANGRLCLDVGCATANFCGVWQGKGGQYYGLDFRSDEVKIARTLHPDVEIFESEFLSWTPTQQFDFVFLSGIAWVNFQKLEKHDYLRLLLAKAREIADVGVAFNFRTGCGDRALSSYKSSDVVRICEEVASGWSVKTGRIGTLTSCEGGYLFAKPSYRFWR